MDTEDNGLNELARKVADAAVAFGMLGNMLRRFDGLGIEDRSDSDYDAAGLMIIAKEGANAALYAAIHEYRTRVEALEKFD